MGFMVHLCQGSDLPGWPVGESSQIKLSSAIAAASGPNSGQNGFIQYGMFPSPETKTPAVAGVFPATCQVRRLALTGLEARVGLADHEDLATTADDLAVAMAGLRRLEGRKDFHGDSWERFDKEVKL